DEPRHHAPARRVFGCESANSRGAHRPPPSRARRLLHRQQRDHGSDHRPMKLGRLNHVGVATPSIEQSLETYRKMFGAEPHGPASALTELWSSSSTRRTWAAC